MMVQLPLPLASNDSRDLNAIWLRFWTCEGNALLAAGWPDVETIPRFDQWLWIERITVPRDEWEALMRLVVTHKRAARWARNADAAPKDGADAVPTHGGAAEERIAGGE